MAEPVVLGLQTRRELLRRALDVVPQVELVDQPLAERLRSRLELVVAPAITALHDELNGTSGSPGAAAPAADAAVAEVLAVLAAAMVRSTGLDAGVCLAAERWMDALSARLTLPQVAVVIPSDRDRTGMVSQVVRLRMPLDGLWSLPVAVHEYGHFVAAALTERVLDDGVRRTAVPVEERLHAAGTGRPNLYDHGHELFADAFATAVVGPAYLQWCLSYRFSPLDATHASRTHPASVRRVRLQLRVLDRMAVGDPGGFLRLAADDLRQQWSSSLKGAGTSEDCAADVLLDELEDWLVELVLTHDRLRRVRYRDHGAAWVLAERALAPVKATRSVPHLVNAAWRCRREVEGGARSPVDVAEQVRELGDRARAVVEEVLAGG